VVVLDDCPIGRERMNAFSSFFFSNIQLSLLTY
jgi:hypothetical protein